jgi:hypothetical protein
MSPAGAPTMVAGLRNSIDRCEAAISMKKAAARETSPVA